MAVLPALAEEQLPDGVYLDLDDKIYFAQDRLGSSDLIKLHRFKEGWWWQSRHNPARSKEQTEAQNYGSALHAIMLEGLGAYETRFAVAPSPSDYEGLLTSIPQIKEALTEAGYDLKGTSKWSLKDWLDCAAVNIPDRPCWEAIKADFEASITDPETGVKRSSVTALEDQMLRLMLDAAREDADVRQLLGYGQDVPVLAEVSFFWTDERGVKRRARFDKPVPKFTLDLKSLGNWQGRELRHSIGDRILQEGYDIQVGDQHDARLRMHRMIQERGDEAISGGTDETRAWLRAIATRNMPFDWVWLFYQKPELSGRAPIIFPLYENWGGMYHKSGYRKAVRAIDFYLSCIDRFGLGDMPDASGAPSRPWSRVEELHFTAEDMEPHITLPHYGWDDTPAPGEEDHLARKAGDILEKDDTA